MSNKTMLLRRLAPSFGAGWLGTPSAFTFSGQSALSTRSTRKLLDRDHAKNYPMRFHRRFIYRGRRSLCRNDWPRPSLKQDKKTIRLFHSTTRTTNNASTKTARLIVPSLGQNSTLNLRSKSQLLSQVQIIPQWRDDTLLELVRADSELDQVGDIPTVTAEPLESSDSILQKQLYGGLQLTFHKGGVETSLGRIGSFVEVDLLENLDKEAESSTSQSSSSTWKLIATVPEKSNITCQVSNGDISVNGKLEGDVHLSTSRNANITVGKLRGHNVVLDNTNKADSDAAEQHLTCDNKGTIYIKKAIEARTVQINASQRIRALMINGSDIQVQVNTSKSINFDKLDEDDEGAVIDVGSLYISHGRGESEASFIVDATTLSGDSDSCRGIVRVKSNHGHVSINATVNSNPLFNETPLVDLGGVNGSCDIQLQAATPPGCLENNTLNKVANRIHFDAFTPESISTITSRGRVGDTCITIDRKLEAELRLLSLAKSAAEMPNDVDAHSLSSDEDEDIQTVLQRLENELESQQVTGRTLDGISIETDAFESSNNSNLQQPSSKVEYIQGTVKNRSGEPDSRFDVQSRGKINRDGAALQALHGFHSKTDGDGSTDDVSQDSTAILPLLCVATDGKIKLETLSWLGSIARRYGLEDNHQVPLGRQASRKPRLEK